MMWGAGWMWIVGPLMMVGVVALVVLLVREAGGVGRSARRDDELDRARRILDERFARGELDTEKYREDREELG